MVTSTLTEVDSYPHAECLGRSQLEETLVASPADTISLGPDDAFCSAIAALVTSAEVTRAEILRAAPAHALLRRFGKIFRQPDRPEEMYALSQQTQRISEFWSHSWKGSTTQKIVLLLLMKHGMAAVIIGTVAAFLTAILTVQGYFPGIHKTPTYQSPGVLRSYTFSPWSMVAGFLVTGVTLVLWRSCRGEQVFLDRACIHQGDPKLKFEGVLNIGAFLRHSSSLVVLWDSSYLSRAWCVLELAAFLKSHENDSKAELVIKPTFLAPATFFVAFGTAFLSFMEICLPPSGSFLPIGRAVYVLVWALVFNCLFQQYERQVDAADEQFRTFSWSGVECYCCSVNHTNPEDGTRLPCDRAVLTSCISDWFGSVEAFDVCMRSKVRGIFVTQIAGLPFGYRWLVGTSCWMFWAMFDFSAARARDGDYPFAAALLMSGIAWVFWIFPANIGLSSVIASWLLRKEGSNRRILYTLVAYAAIAFKSIAPHGIMFLCFRTFANPLFAMMVFCFVTLVLSALCTRFIIVRTKPHVGSMHLGAGHFA